MGTGMLVTVLGTLISSHELGTCCLLACGYEGRAETAPGEEDARNKVSASDGSPLKPSAPCQGMWLLQCLGGTLGPAQLCRALGCKSVLLPLQGWLLLARGC